MHLEVGPAITARCSSSIYPCIEATHSSYGIGVRGKTEYGEGVSGHSNMRDGIGTSGYGPTYSRADFPVGNYTPGGFFAGRNGVIGYTEEINGAAVKGRADNTTAWAGIFTSSGHGVNIISGAGKTGLSVSGGSKAAVVETESGKRQLYCEESSEVWFTDYGFGQLESGLDVIAIDPVFAQTVNLDEPYHVFIQVYGDADVYVAERTREAFEVSLRDGDARAEFSYRLIAKRKGFEGDRLAIFQDAGVLQQIRSERE